MSGQLAERLRSTVKANLIAPSAFAEQRRVLPGLRGGPWSFYSYEWLRGVHDDPARHVGVRKGSQLGFTETAINRTLHSIMILMADTLYVLPTKDDAADFSSGRLDLAIRNSPAIRQAFTDISNKHHKLAHSTNLYIRGSNSKSQLSSVPVGVLVVDEYDFMDKEQIEMAHERLSGTRSWIEIDLSTPTIPGEGIDRIYQEGDQRIFTLECPYCHKESPLVFPDSVGWVGEKAETAYYRCAVCQHRLSETDRRKMISRGVWAAQSKSEMHTYWINQLYSPTVTVAEIIDLYLRSRTDPIAEQRFYNYKLGIAHVASGARLSVEEYQSCQLPGLLMATSAPYSAMGVDVGNFLYYEIVTRSGGNKRILRAGRVVDWNEIAALIKEFGVRVCVVDWQPETRSAREFQAAHGEVWLCRYPEMREQIRVREDVRMVDVNRTEALDYVLGRVRKQTVEIPMDVPSEHKDHFRSVTRIYREVNSRTIAAYVKGGSQDHSLHAAVYAEVGLALMPSYQEHLDIIAASGVTEPTELGVFELPMEVY